MPYALGAVLAERSAPVPPRGGDAALRAVAERSVPARGLIAVLTEALVDCGVRLGFREWAADAMPLYRYLRGRRIEAGALPLRVIERRGSDGSSRVEHVFIGTRDQVLLSRRLVREALERFLTDAGMSWLVSVGRPCMDSHRLWSLEEATAPEDVPVQDLESLLSDWGRRGGPLPGDFREIGDCSCEGAHLLESLGVTAADCEAPWSGSCGIDVHRLVTAMLFQHGAGPDDWPEWLRLRYRGLPASG